MSRLPLVVIGGYLGAGKTTIIRHLLSHAGGLRLLVLVNDFGAINIDSKLIQSSDGDTIALSNGCVCCSMTGDLFFAIGDALDRRPRPDLVIVEASGVGDPARIAAIALAEPELEYAGIVTVVDALTACDLLNDELVGPQIASQIAAADLIVLSKADCINPAPAADRIATLSPVTIIVSSRGVVDLSVICGLSFRIPVMPRKVDHSTKFVTWSGITDRVIANQQARIFLDAIPSGVFRIKGWLNLPRKTIEIHRVGRQHQQFRTNPRQDSQLVAIGLTGRFDPEHLQQAWLAVTAVNSEATQQI